MTTDNYHQQPMTNTMDFTPRPSAAFSAAFERLIDEAMQEENAAQPKRNYLGASRLGEECLRKLAYEFHHTPKDEGREFKGRTLRIFDRGHDAEERMAAYLRLAGFEVVTHRPDGQQIRFGTAWSEEHGCYLISGGCDGVITKAPYNSGVVCPSLWEMKALGEKSFNDLVKKGLRASKPVYFVQMQLYMAYLELSENPGLFTALNSNTGEIYSERVPFDRAAAQEASDKGAKIVRSREPEELPRCAAKATDFRCKFCDYQSRCWVDERARLAVGMDVKTWSFGARA